MPAGLDTGFFFALQEKHPTAIKVWHEQESMTNVIVLYELHKLLLKGEFKKWPTIIDDICSAVDVIILEKETALRASRIAHGTGIPGLDALILTSFLDAECSEIYTTDSHFDLYKKDGVTITNLS
jgi:predicted nucleic acid-binding protein